jgi:hypothetical protein
VILGALLRCRAGLTNNGAEFIESAFFIVEIAIDNLQTHNERTQVDTRCYDNSIRMSARYERRSILITANQPLGAWGQGILRSRYDVGSRGSPRPPRHDFRDQRR